MSASGAIIGDFKFSLGEYIKRVGMNPTQYARAVGFSNSGLVFLVLQGKKPVPLDDIDRWLEPLKLSDAERTALIVRAIEDYAPPYVLRVLNTMRFEIAGWMKLVEGAMRQAGLNPPPAPDLFASLGARKKKSKAAPAPEPSTTPPNHQSKSPPAGEA